MSRSRRRLVFLGEPGLALLFHALEETGELLIRPAVELLEAKDFQLPANRIFPAAHFQYASGSSGLGVSILTSGSSMGGNRFKGWL